MPVLIYCNKVRTEVKMEKPILSWSDSGILFIKFNRPKKFNALSCEMYQNIIELLREAHKNDSIKIVAFTGTGKFYSSGHDFSNFQQTADSTKNLIQYPRALINFTKPLIALVNGPSYGMAVVTLPLFDFVIAAESSTFQVPTTQLGLSPIGASTYTFPSIMGHIMASEMLVFGREISAKDALQCGLVSKVISDDLFLSESLNLLGKFARFPLQSLLTTKHLLVSVKREQLEGVIEQEWKSMEERLATPETKIILQKTFNRKAKL